MTKKTAETYRLARHLKRALQTEMFGNTTVYPDGKKFSEYIGEHSLALEAVARLYPERRADIVRTLNTLREEGYVEEYVSGFNGWTYVAGQVMLPPTAHVCALLDGRNTLPNNIF